MSGDLNQLDLSFGRFLAAHSDVACDLLFRAGRLVSQARRGGNICVELQMVDSSIPVVRLREELLSTTLVGGAGDYCPLIIHNDLLYLHRYFNYETIVVDFIKRATGASLPQGVEESLEPLFPRENGGTNYQRLAAESSLCHQFAVISGGPGTGKTTTVAKVLALHVSLNPDMRIMLCAPTGKAATRLEEALREVCAELAVSAEIREKIVQPVQTIHRLLGFARSGFRYTADNLLPADLVLVDEASMVDLPLMADLMGALPLGCRLILLGDAYQLASVQPGAVLAEICAGGKPEQEPPAIVTLKKSFRFAEDSGIRLLAESIKQGDGKGALDILQDEKYSDVTLVPHDVASLASTICRVYTGETPGAMLAGFAKIGVLCCHRTGDYGVVDINTQAMAHLGREIHQYYHGLPLMILANDHALGVYNGDTCVVVEQDGRFYACLPGAEGVRMILVRKLPVHGPAYGITVHKSQGSEYDEVAFLLPPGGSQVLGRELIYTAITRARRKVVVYGEPGQFVDAVGRRVVRMSGLASRLKT